MLVIDNFFKISNLERHSTDLVNLQSFFFFLLVLRFESFLVLNEFLLHEDVIFDSFLSEQAETTF